MQELNVYQSINEIFDRQCMKFAADADLMERLRNSPFYARQLSLGRSEHDAICNAVRTL